MSRKILFIIGVHFLLFSCQSLPEEKNRVPPNVKSEQKQNDNTIIKTEHLSGSGKKFILTEDHSQGASLVALQVQTQYFTETNERFDLGTIDPIENTFFADLDKNGYEEFYIVSRSAGSGSYSSIRGFASNKDKSVSMIYVPEISEKDQAKNGLFEGYRGHNQFSLENGVLVNQFPVYRETDPNAKPSGGHRKVYYTLSAGEASWILKADKMASKLYHNN